jgi:NADH-quinone oxidoreductase subunit L
MWQGGAAIAVVSIGGSFVIALYLLYEVIVAGAFGGSFRAVEVAGFEWVPQIRMGLLVDNLSALMLVLVSFLSMLIAIYSIGYMAHEDGKPRYYAEISLFVAGMLGTVSADNFLQLLIFWEIMGLCSYLLIGFWYKKPEAASAAKKAFLVTRIGDVLFLLGVIAIWTSFGTFRFEEIAPRVGELSRTMLTVIPLLLFGGAMGKSAQFPLHVWLPDAMEGPTTVSALIHAATMVKAGVYLTARSFIFLAPQGVPAPTDAILFIAVIGGFTAFFAATMALTQYDIKRVLAYSTISQLGYMFLGLGVGAYLISEGQGSGGYSAALYHLTNHAFFKALLFLSAGSVIHAVKTNDMRQMGGLRKSMRVTSTVMLFGALALAGIVPFSGFWSKDEILSLTFESGSTNMIFYALYALGLLTAFMTAFYTFRLWFMTFRGEYRGKEHPHESPRSMTFPLIILAVFALVSGMLFFGNGGFSNLIFFREAEGLSLDRILARTFSPMELSGILAWVSLLVAVAGVMLAWMVYDKRRIPAEKFTSTPSRAFVHRMLSNRYWIDNAYNAVAYKGYYAMARGWDWFDRNVVDGVVNAAGKGGILVAKVSDRFDRRAIDGTVNAISLRAVRGGAVLRTGQTGKVQNYGNVVVLGLVLVILVIFTLKVILPMLGV